jgi:hypothetical protein
MKYKSCKYFTFNIKIGLDWRSARLAVDDSVEDCYIVRYERGDEDVVSGLISKENVSTFLGNNGKWDGVKIKNLVVRKRPGTELDRLFFPYSSNPFCYINSDSMVRIFRLCSVSESIIKKAMG